MEVVTSNLGVRFNIIELGIVSFILVEVLLRIGNGVTCLFRSPNHSHMQDMCARWLLGIVLLGTLYMGLGLCGILFTSVALLAPVAMALACCPTRKVQLYGILRHILFRGWIWIFLTVTALIILAGIVVSPTVFANAFCEDSLAYHFGLPWQSLMMHRIPLCNVSYFFHQSLPVDMSYVLPLCFGDDRLTKVICGGSIAATALFAGDWLARQGLTSASWLPLLLIVCAGETLACAIGPKNDLVAASLFIVGGLLWRDRSLVVGAVLLGAAVTCKLTSAPFVLAWMAFYPPRNWRNMSPLTIFVIPILPWMLKSWLVTGDPLFPAGWRLFNSPFWNSVNQSGLRLISPWFSGVFSVEGGIIKWSIDVLREYPLHVIALPFAWWAGKRREIGAIAMGSVLSLFVAAHPRYLMPGIWMLGVVISVWCSSLGGRIGKTVRVAVPLAAIILIFQSAQFKSIRWDHFFQSARLVRSQELTTYGAVVEELARYSAKRTLLIGGWRTYLMPSRVLFNGYWGETPIVWAMVKDSPSVERLAARFRQLGLDSIVENVVSADFVLHSQKSFEWDGNMLELYYVFCRDHLAMVQLPEQVDHANGGFYLMKLNHSRSSSNVREDMFFLPGAETVLAEADDERLAGRPERAMDLYRKILDRTPGIAHFQSKYAESLAAAGRWKEVFHMLYAASLEGYADIGNLFQLGLSAAHLEKWDVAIATFERSLNVYGRDDVLCFNLATTYVARAETRVIRKLWKTARSDLDRAEEIFATIPVQSRLVDPDRRKNMLKRIKKSRNEISG